MATRWSAPSGRARFYFGCGASMLTPAQAAFVAALPQQPSRFNPYRSPKTARARQRAVVARMQAEGALSAGQAREALTERLVFARPRTPFLAPHFVEMVLAVAGDDRPARIATTLDAELQAEVEGIVAGHRESLSAHGAANVAVVVLENATGAWLAWEGSGDYFDTAHGGAINGPLAPRQPGSALKPLTYALAFEQGGTPATLLPDIPTHFPTAEPGVLFSPRNYDGRYRGPLLARRALAGSENVPAVALAARVGVPALLRFFGRAGLTTFDRTAAHYGLGITLGNAEVRLAELVGAYAAFARGGTWIRPRWDANAPTPEQVPLVSAQTAFWITDILSDPDAREVHLRPGRFAGVPVPGGGQDRDLAGVSRQLDDRVHARRDRRRVGRQFRPDAAARLERRDRRRADLPRRDAGGRARGPGLVRCRPMRRWRGRRRAWSRSRSARCQGCGRARPARPACASGCRRAPRCSRAVGTTRATRGCSWCGRPSTASGRSKGDCCRMSAGGGWSRLAMTGGGARRSPRSAGPAARDCQPARGRPLLDRPDATAGVPGDRARRGGPCPRSDRMARGRCTGRPCALRPTAALVADARLARDHGTRRERWHRTNHDHRPLSRRCGTPNRIGLLFTTLLLAGAAGPLARQPAKRPLGLDDLQRAASSESPGVTRRDGSPTLSARPTPKRTSATPTCGW